MTRCLAMPLDALVFYRTTGRLLRLSLRHTGQRSPLRKAASGQPWAVRFVRPWLKVHAQKLVSMVVGAGFYPLTILTSAIFHGIFIIVPSFRNIGDTFRNYWYDSHSHLIHMSSHLFTNGWSQHIDGSWWSLGSQVAGAEQRLHFGHNLRSLAKQGATKN
jgi:hypothetical protein